MPDSTPPITAGAAVRDRATPHAVIGGSAIDALHVGLAGHGARLGRFVMLDKVGEGAMGVVFSAYDETLDRKVAIKLIRDVGNAEDRRRIRREAQAMARLSHPNVAQIYEAGEVGDRLYMAMEFVPGSGLDVWQTSARRPWSEILEMYTAVGHGLAAAHAGGILHRDFKPHNVLIGGDGRPRVIDFGLARAPGASGKAPVHDGDLAEVDLHAALTRVGTVVGTPAYMALEQFQGQPLDARTDQFAFCVALYEAVYHRSPYPRTELGALLVALDRHEVAPPPADADAPPWLFDVLRRGLHPDPAARWPSLPALLAELGRDRELDPDTGRLPRLLFVGAVGLTTLVSTVIGRLVNGWEAIDIEQAVLFAVMVQVVALGGLFVGRRTVLASAFNRRIAAFFLTAIGMVLGGRLLIWSLGADPAALFAIELTALTALSALAAMTIARWFWTMAATFGAGVVVAAIWPVAMVPAYTVAVPLGCTLAVIFTVDRQAARSARRQPRGRPSKNPDGTKSTEEPR